MKNKLIIGITGASGVVYGIRLLEMLKETEIETHLIVSAAGHQAIKIETDLTRQEVNALADVVHHGQDVGASISSGSVRTMGMIIAPCTMKTLAEIATGVTPSLMSRAADVVLKERRKLVLMTRETPLHQVHVENMLKVTQMGGIICPPAPAFYTRPESLEELVNHAVGRVLDLFDIDVDGLKRWRAELEAETTTRAIAPGT